ncbi:MAG: hypothetical protein MUF27_14470 [Acidobacteria bacterium]|jgi:hypothetical protein|nr:hypothetical protein [Acidobacteriota bacterium]
MARRPARRPGPAPAAALARLEALRTECGPAPAQEKLAAIAALDRARLPHADAVLRLHEALSFLAAYPDDERVRSAAEFVLQRFAGRADLRGARRALEGSGIAGTDIVYPFFAPTARWLARDWPERLSVAWSDLEHPERLLAALPLLATYSESPALDEYDFPVREWLRRLAGLDVTDATWIVRRTETLTRSSFLHEALYQELELTLRLAWGDGGPSRTLDRWPTGPVHCFDAPLRRQRPDLRRELRRRPLAVEPVDPRDGRRLVELARRAMITRARDLDAFAWGSADDVRLVRWDDGLVFALIGQVPERRLMLESVYGILTLQNGVPIGYALISSLFRSSEIAYNVFDAFRGGEAAWVFARMLATARAVFGASAFVIVPYQLGHDNDEGLDSGAFWFYAKLGFAPRDPETLRLMQSEERRIKAKPGYRSDRATLQRLSAENAFLDLGRPRRDVMGALPMADATLAVVRELAARGGADRERAVASCREDTIRLLGAAAFRGMTPGEKLALDRWAPLVCVLPGVERWPAADRRALAGVIRAKGGRRESEFVLRFDAHARLRRSLAALALRESKR